MHANIRNQLKDASNSNINCFQLVMQWRSLAIRGGAMATVAIRGMKRDRGHAWRCSWIWHRSQLQREQLQPSLDAIIVNSALVQ